MKLRTAVIDAWEVGTFAARFGDGFYEKLYKMQLLLYWGMCAGRMTSKGVKAVRVEKLVERWHKAVVGMCTAHSKDDYDAHDFQADDLMRPLLTAPIRQVRQFWVKLQRSLRNDPKVPFFVWVSFEAWGKTMVKHAEDDSACIALRDKLADEIASLVNLDIRDQLPEAIARALRWRDADTLKQVKAAVTNGGKPRMVGRQSCLFLEVGNGENTVRVML